MSCSRCSRSSSSRASATSARTRDTARRFIDEQIKLYEKKLEEAENRLKEFRLKYLNLVGAEGRDYFARWPTLAEQLNNARLELRAAEQSRDALKRELAGEEPVFVAGARPARRRAPTVRSSTPGSTR